MTKAYLYKHLGEEVYIDPTWKLLSKDQKVGTHPGAYIIRDLYEAKDGTLISVQTSKEIYREDEARQTV